jgi:hypothetical protein
MLHWHSKLPAIVLVALVLASALGKGHGIGFFW